MGSLKCPVEEIGIYHVSRHQLSTRERDDAVVANEAPARSQFRRVENLHQIVCWFINAKNRRSNGEERLCLINPLLYERKLSVKLTYQLAQAGINLQVFRA